MSAESTYVFGAADAKISPLTSDSGTAPVYGTAIDVPGLKSISVTGKSSIKELKGDERTIAKISKLDSVEVELEFAEWSPQLFSIFTGADLELGEGNDYSVTLGALSKGSYFKIEAVSLGASGAGSNVSIVLPKLICTELPDMIGLSESDFKTVKISAEALPTISSSEWIQFNYNSTAVEL